MGEQTEFSKWIEETYKELINRFVAADGKLTDREYDEVFTLRRISKQILKVSESMELFEKTKEIAEFNRKKDEGSQA